MRKTKTKQKLFHNFVSWLDVRQVLQKCLIERKQRERERIWPCCCSELFFVLRFHTYTNVSIMPCVPYAISLYDFYLLNSQIGCIKKTNNSASLKTPVDLRPSFFSIFFESILDCYCCFDIQSMYYYYTSTGEEVNDE